MRTQSEMFALICHVAEADERVRAVLLNGSRADPEAVPDRYQDYDIVYVVTDLKPFTADHSWIDVFGERLLLQMPETMRNPSGEGHFNWMMLFADGNRLDLTLVPAHRPELALRDPLRVVLLDKDGVIPPPERGRKYLVQWPSELFFRSCCNNFWWCLQNVAKGLARDELPYAMMMYHGVVRAELHDNMVEWYIGARSGFSVSAGKMGKYFRRHLPGHLYRQYCDTYAGSDTQALWSSLFVMCDLFHVLAVEVARELGFVYMQGEEDGMRVYLRMVQEDTLE